MRLFVGGLHLGGSAYPNAEQTLKLLHSRLNVEIVECGAWLPESMHLWRLAKQGGFKLLMGLARLAFGNLTSLLRVMWRAGRSRTPVYVPYPAIFFLWWASWVPLRWRPWCIADAYISVWDSFARDRAQGGRNGTLSRILKSFERRALRAAWLVLVDTEANRQMFVEEFGLHPERVRSLPLAIDEERFLNARRTSQKTTNDQVTVLFVGTMIPLHGIDVILEAIRQLLPDPKLCFRLIGDGQLSDKIANFIATAGSDRVKWLRGWQSIERIAQEIADADICLGVFGGDGKAARVLPFKLYMYFASGKAVISQGHFSLPNSVLLPPMLIVPKGNAFVLTQAICLLGEDTKQRSALGIAAADYFRENLGSDCIVKHWLALLKVVKDS